LHFEYFNVISIVTTKDYAVGYDGIYIRKIWHSERFPWQHCFYSCYCVACRFQCGLLIVVLPCILLNIKLFFQQMQYSLKHKMLRFLFKCFFTQLLNISAPLDHLHGAHISKVLMCTPWRWSKGTETCRSCVKKHLNTNRSILCF
jgi:hypothetical protein